MATPTRSYILAVATTTTALIAQQTIVVDESAGPGHDFTSIAPAVASAAPGDTVLVRAGSYSEPQIVVSRGLSIVGEGTVEIVISGVVGSMAGFLIGDLPADEAFAISNLSLEGSFAIEELRAQRCHGSVTVRDVTGNLINGMGIPASIVLMFEECDQVHIDDVFVRLGNITFDQSRGSVTRCALEGSVGSVLDLISSEVTLEAVTITGTAGPFTIEAPVVLANSVLRVSGTMIEADVPTTPQPAIQSTQSTVELDPTATLTPATGQPDISGTATVINRELTTLTTSRSPGFLDQNLQSQAGSVFATFASLPAPLLPSPFGPLWFDPTLNIVLDSGVLQTRNRQSQFAIPTIPTGAQIIVQTVVLTPTTGFETSNGTVVVF